MKKGLSAIVSTILLIVFVISLGVMVMSWSRGLLSKSIKTSETKIGSELECDDVKIKLEPIEGNKIVIKNNGNKDLYGYIIRKMDENKNVIVDDKNKITTPVESYSADTYNYGSNVDAGDKIFGDSVKKIEIIPKISIEGGEIVDCTNKIGAYTF